MRELNIFELTQVAGGGSSSCNQPCKQQQSCEPKCAPPPCAPTVGVCVGVGCIRATLAVSV
jgi:hypothetical protein